jgi:exonuclease V gamma subunit
LGMGEDFPREEKKHSLNLLLSEKKKEFFPTQKEKDRALFLEAILSARKTLYISFPLTAEEKEGVPLLLAELLSYIKTGYSFEKEAFFHLVNNAPSLSFDRSYFEEKGKHKSFSESSFRAAQSFYRPPKSIKNFWVQEFALKEESVVDVKSLELLAFHPVKFFFQKSLRIFLEEEKKEFFLSPWERASLRALFLKKEKKEILALLEKGGSLPSGMAREIVKKEIEEDLSSYEEQLHCLGVNKKEVFSLDMTEGCETFLEREGGWIVPPVELMVGDRKVKIVGKIEGLCKEGLLYHARGQFLDYVRIWPRFLLALQFPFVEKKEILFSKTGRKKMVALEGALSFLTLYLQYYEKSKKRLSPLLREWSEPLLLGQEEELQSVIDASLEVKKEEDPYLHRLFSLSQKPTASFLNEEWSSIVQPLFSPLIHMFPLKTKKEPLDEIL